MIKPGIGTVRWSVFGILILIYVLVYFQRMAPAVVSSDLMAAFNTSGAELGTLAAIYFYAYGFLQIPAGALADSLGVRKTVMIGNLIAGLGSILFGLAPTLMMAGLGRLLVGLGGSVIFVGIMKSNSIWFKESQYGSMSGLTVFFGNLGSISAAGPLAMLLAFISWRPIFWGLGVVAILLSVLVWVMVRNRPEDYGFESVSHAPLHDAPNVRVLFGHFWRVVKNRQLWPGFLVNFFSSGGLYAFMGLWVIPYLRDVRGLSRPESSVYATLLVVGFALGAIGWGWISDHLKNRKRVLLLSLLFYVLSWVLMTFTSWPEGWIGYLLFAAMGFSGIGFLLTLPNAKELSDPRFSGIAVATVNMGSFIGVAVAQPVFGKIVDYFWDGLLVDGVRVYSAAAYQAAFIMMLLAGVVAIFAALFIKETHCRNRFSG